MHCLSCHITLKFPGHSRQIYICLIILGLNIFFVFFQVLFDGLELNPENVHVSETGILGEKNGLFCNYFSFRH